MVCNRGPLASLAMTPVEVVAAGVALLGMALIVFSPLILVVYLVRSHNAKSRQVAAEQQQRPAQE